MPNIIGVTRTIFINCSADVALPILWEIQNLEQYEPKVFSAQVQKDTQTTGTYIARGFFGFLPWQAKFSYKLTKYGFISELLSSPLASLNVKGGFLVKALNNRQCMVIHYEKYQLPQSLIFITPLIKYYVNWSIGRELNNLAALIHKTTVSIPQESIQVENNISEFLKRTSHSKTSDYKLFEKWRKRMTPTAYQKSINLPENKEAKEQMKLESKAGKSITSR